VIGLRPQCPPRFRQRLDPSLPFCWAR